jgi:endogenous inhibitor of DNA gyrase (YacG/DUF329 family)
MAARCPTCGKALPDPRDPKVAPFCSARCKQIDLGQWLKGAYAVPSDAPVPESYETDRDD